MAQIKETGLRSLLLSAIDPFGMMRNFLLKPASEVATSVFEHYRTRTKEGVISAREVLIRVGLIAFIAAIVIWTSVFMYLAFYYTYMPAIAHIRPVHMQFRYLAFILSSELITNDIIMQCLRIRRWTMLIPFGPRVVDQETATLDGGSILQSAHQH